MLLATPPGSDPTCTRADTSTLCNVAGVLVVDFSRKKSAKTCSKASKRPPLPASDLCATSVYLGCIMCMCPRFARLSSPTSSVRHHCANPFAMPRRAIEGNPFSHMWCPCHLAPWFLVPPFLLDPQSRESHRRLSSFTSSVPSVFCILPSGKQAMQSTIFHDVQPFPERAMYECIHSTKISWDADLSISSLGRSAICPCKLPHRLNSSLSEGKPIPGIKTAPRSQRAHICAVR